MRVITTNSKAPTQTRFGLPLGKECLDRTETTPETQAISRSKSTLRNLIR